MGVYRCCCSLMNMKFLRFQYVKNKARDIRLFHKWCPTLLLELFPNSIPSSYSYYLRRESLCKYMYFIYMLQEKE